MDNYLESLNKIADSVESKNRIEYGTSFDETSFQKAIGELINLQYSVGKDALCEYLRSGATQAAYNKLLNSYTFIPMNSIIEDVAKVDPNCSITFDTNWFNYGCKIREYIKIDVQRVEGNNVQVLLSRLADYFPEGVRMSNILSETMEPVLHIDPDILYFLTLKINPKTYNPYGKISKDLMEIAALDDDIDKEDIDSAVTDIVKSDYIPWAIKAQSELYNWLMNFQGEYVSAPLKENESLSDGQESYEIRLNVVHNEGAIDWTELVKRTLPLSQTFQCVELDNCVLSIGFSQNTGSLMQKIFPNLGR